MNDVIGLLVFLTFLLFIDLYRSIYYFLLIF